MCPLAGYTLTLRLPVAARAIAVARREAPLGAGEPEAFREWRGASVLVIDELGFESRDPEPDIFGLIDDRYARHRPTVVTSGLTRDDLIARYGFALVRRVAEEGLGALVDCYEAERKWCQ